MQPLKLLIVILVGLPVSVFLLTLLLSDGAPLQPLAPREEGGPAAATHNPPQSKLGQSDLERGDSVAATGHRLDTGDGGAGSARIINHKRDARMFMTLFGVPHAE